MPAHIFIQGEKFTNTGNIVQWIASRTGWPVVTDSDLLQQAGDRSGMGADRIERALGRGNRPTKRAVCQREKAVACLKRTLADTLRQEAGIFSGTAGHLIPPNMPHTLRVLVTAGTDHRIRRASRDRHMNEKDARRQIRKSDFNDFQRQCHFTGSGGGSASYDLVVPTDVLDTEAAAHLILENLTEKAKAAPEDVKRAVADFALSADVELAMAEKRYSVTAAASGGHVKVTIDRKVIRPGKRAEKLKRLVGAMPEVAAVDVAVGRDFHEADIVRRARFELSPGTAFEGHAKHLRHLRTSAIGNLPAELRQRPRPSVGIGRPLSL